MLVAELERQTEPCTLSQSHSDVAQLEGAHIFPAAVRSPLEQDDLQSLDRHVK